MTGKAKSISEKKRIARMEKERLLARAVEGFRQQSGPSKLGYRKFTKGLLKEHEEETGHSVQLHWQTVWKHDVGLVKKTNISSKERRVWVPLQQ